MEKLIFPVSVTQKEQLLGVLIFEFNFDANLRLPIAPEIPPSTRPCTRGPTTATNGKWDPSSPNPIPIPLVWSLDTSRMLELLPSPTKCSTDMFTKTVLALFFMQSSKKRKKRRECRERRREDKEDDDEEEK